MTELTPITWRTTAESRTTWKPTRISLIPNRDPVYVLLKTQDAPIGNRIIHSFMQHHVFDIWWSQLVPKSATMNQLQIYRLTIWANVIMIQPIFGSSMALTCWIPQSVNYRMHLLNHCIDLLIYAMVLCIIKLIHGMIGCNINFWIFRKVNWSRNRFG